MLSDATLNRIADAFGLRTDYREGSFGPNIVVSTESRGFITCTPRDALMSCPSEIALTCGGTLELDKVWEVINKKDDLQKLGFTCPGATFVAVDFYGRPERVFLYPKAHGFDIEMIIELLAAHRRHVKPARWAA